MGRRVRALSKCSLLRFGVSALFRNSADIDEHPGCFSGWVPENGPIPWEGAVA